MASIVKHAISFSRPLNGLIKIQASWKLVRIGIQPRAAVYNSNQPSFALDVGLQIACT
jgi:hypothetical protein